jgi:uncharacterized paraquat-inducible protein A
MLLGSRLAEATKGCRRAATEGNASENDERIRLAFEEKEATMRGRQQLGCWRCELRYYLKVLLHTRFEYCERCKATMRRTENAWKSWSSAATRLSPPR